MTTPLRDINYLCFKDIGNIMGLSDHMTRKHISLNRDFPTPEVFGARAFWKRREVMAYLKSKKLPINQ